jgi:glycosyltransferase involved in cell wall biosynthesis
MPKGLRKLVRSAKYFEESSQVFATELRRIEFGDVLLWTTLFPYQLRGLGLLGPDLPKSFLFFHNAPGWGHPFGEELWHKAFQSLPPSASRLHFGVFEPELFLEVERLLPLGEFRLERFPIPHDGAPPRQRAALGTVGILGHQRETKGLQRLRENVERITQMGFRVIVQDSQEAVMDEVTAGIDGALRFGYVDDLPALVSQCDALFLDYDTRMYRFSGSGIAWEAVASGVPLVVPAGTTMSRLVEGYGLGARFSAADPEDRFSALSRVKARFREFSENAMKAATAFRSRNGTARFVDSVIQGISQGDNNDPDAVRNAWWPPI